MSHANLLLIFGGGQRQCLAVTCRAMEQLVPQQGGWKEDLQGYFLVLFVPVILRYMHISIEPSREFSANRITSRSTSRTKYFTLRVDIVT
jgi:hypothetical protein